VRAPLAVQKKLPVRRSLLNHIGMQLVPRFPRLIQVLVVVLYDPREPRLFTAREAAVLVQCEGSRDRGDGDPEAGLHSHNVREPPKAGKH